MGRGGVNGEGWGWVGYMGRDGVRVEWDGNGKGWDSNVRQGRAGQGRAGQGGQGRAGQGGARQ